MKKTNTKISRSDNMQNLKQLKRCPDHVNSILSIYLDISERIQFVKPLFKWHLISAKGIGYDGGRTEVHIADDGSTTAIVYDSIGGARNLPFLNGKILSMLYAMGYQLPEKRLKIAKRYLRYVQTGISNLDTIEGFRLKRDPKIQLIDRRIWANGGIF